MGKPRGAEGKRKGQGGHHKEQTVILRLIAQRTRNLFVSWDTCSVPSQSARHREYWNILARSCLPPTFKGHGWGGGLSSLLSVKVRAHHRNMGSERARARERGRGGGEDGTAAPVARRSMCPPGSVVVAGKGSRTWRKGAACRRVGVPTSAAVERLDRSATGNHEGDRAEHE